MGLFVGGFTAAMVTEHLHFLEEFALNLAGILRIGPEKGVIHIALGAVDNALWDMFARSRKVPLWKLIADMTPVCFHVIFCFYPWETYLHLGRARQRYRFPLHHRCADT